MVPASVRKTKSKGPYARPENLVELRPALRAVGKQLSAFRAAVPQDTDRGIRDSPINRSPIAADIELIFSEIVKAGGLQPFELAFTIDIADKSNKAVQDLLNPPKGADYKPIKNLRAALLQHMRNRCAAHGLPKSYIQNRQQTKIVIMGPEV